MHTVFGTFVHIIRAGIFLLLYTQYANASCVDMCNGHGYCADYDMCVCIQGADGLPAFTGADCSERTCPRGIAWVGDVVTSNNVHPLAECSNKGLCDRATGTCMCYLNYEGLACERTVCPNNCSGRGECYTQRQLANEVNAVYETPWDADKQVGCVCDAGYRGMSCSMIECPSGADPMKGFGNESGRECSGRGICDYMIGACHCFAGFYGNRCQFQTTVFFY